MKGKRVKEWTIHTGQYYHSRYFWLACDGGHEYQDGDHTDTSGAKRSALRKLRAAADAFCVHVNAQQNVESFRLDWSVGFPYSIALDDWPDGECFGAWWDEWVKAHNVEVID